jgi:hypothetical protein
MTKTLATEDPSHELTGEQAAAEFGKVFRLQVPEKRSALIHDIDVRHDVEIDGGVNVTMSVARSRYRSIRLRLTGEAARELYRRLQRVIER